MAVDIQMPSSNGSRSTTHTPSTTPGDGNDSNSDAKPTDTEVGWDYENTVNSVAIVLAEPADNSLIT